MKPKTCLTALFLSLAASCHSSYAETLQATIAWQYQDLPRNMRVFQLKPGSNPALWSTQSTKDLQKIPLGEEIKQGVLQLEKGASKRFLLVYANPGNTPLYFFATPHHMEPAEFSLGLKFKCLCIDHAFTVGPQETWYRVVELRTSRNMLGNQIRFTHTLVGIDKARMGQFAVKQETE